MQQPTPTPSPLADAKLWVAIAALVQPWIIAIWKRFLRRGKLRVYSAGNIEIGFSTYGPTLGLRGTVHAKHRDVFVTSASVVITRLRDKAELQLGWLISRPTTIYLSGEAPSTAELAASFLLKTTEPASYSVVFTQAEFATDHAAASQKLVKEWNEFLNSHPVTDQASRADRYEEFRKSTTSVSQLWSELNNTFFWHPGEYQLRFAIAVENPASEMIQEWRFRLT